MVDFEKMFLEVTHPYEEKTTWIAIHNNTRLTINGKDSWGTKSGGRSAVNWHCQYVIRMERYRHRQSSGLEPGQEPDWHLMEVELKQWAKEHVHIIDEKEWKKSE